MVLSFGGIPASLTGGWLADKTKKRILVIMIGLLISLTSILPIWFPGALFLIITIGCFVIQWGVNMVIGPFLTLPAMSVPPSMAGKATGYATTWAFAGPIVSTYLGGYIVTASKSYNFAFIIFALAGLAAFASCIFIKKHLPQVSIERDKS